MDDTDDKLQSAKDGPDQEAPDVPADWVESFNQAAARYTAEEASDPLLACLDQIMDVPPADHARHLDLLEAQCAELLRLAQDARLIGASETMGSLAAQSLRHAAEVAGDTGLSAPAVVATALLATVAGLLAAAREGLYRVPMSDGVDIYVDGKAHLGTARAAVTLLVARSEILGVYRARVAATKRATASRVEKASKQRADALAVAAELKRTNPTLSKNAIAAKLVERELFAEFATARDALRNWQWRPETDAAGECDDDSPV